MPANWRMSRTNWFIYATWLKSSTPLLHNTNVFKEPIDTPKSPDPDFIEDKNTSPSKNPGICIGSLPQKKTLEGKLPIALGKTIWFFGCLRKFSKHHPQNKTLLLPARSPFFATEKINKSLFCRFLESSWSCFIMRLLLLGLELHIHVLWAPFGFFSHFPLKYFRALSDQFS